MKPRGAGATLDVKLQVGEGAVKLAQLKELSTQLQRVLAAVASHLAESTTPGIDFEIVEAGVGSLTLGLRAVAEEGATLEPERVITTFTEDLAHIRQQDYRPDLTTGLTKHYRALVTCLGGEGAVVEYSRGNKRVVVDDAFRKGFEIALKERVAEDVSVVGYLDAVNAHRAPYTFYLYPKLEDIERVECRFAAEMLQAVAALLRKTVKVEGHGALRSRRDLSSEDRSGPRATRSRVGSWCAAFHGRKAGSGTGRRERRLTSNATARPRALPTRKRRLYWDSGCFIALFNKEPTTPQVHLDALQATFEEMLAGRIRIITSDIYRVELRDRRDAREISPHGLRVAKGRLEARMTRALGARITSTENRRFAKHLARYEDALFVFLDRPDLEATNWPAEHAIRPAVVNRKTCGGNRTQRGARTQAVLMSLLRTCYQQGHSAIRLLNNMLREPTPRPQRLLLPSYCGW
jgi:transposase